MRIAFPLTALAVTVLLLGGSAAFAQQNAAPKGKGAGAECARITDAKKRDECVHQAEQKAKEMEKQKGNATKNDPKGKKN